MSVADQDGFRQKLLDLRESTLSEIGYTEQELKMLQEQTGAERQDEGMGGSASFTLDREIDRALDESDRQTLRAINAALERIEEGTYGACTDCGKPIALGRLEARPYAARCIDCSRHRPVG
jgi:DnaK suppressor protein